MADLNRRQFIQSTALASAALVLPTGCLAKEEGSKNLFDISLAEWSLHRMLRKKHITNLDFPLYTKKTFDIHAVEYVNSFFKANAKDKKYLTELKKRCDDNGIKSVLIMVDGEGALGDADEKKRQSSIEKHYKWVEAAKFLGCHSIRVNALSSGTYEEQMHRAADGLNKLGTWAKDYGIHVIVENHGGNSSRGDWLSETIKKTKNKNVGTLPDFGNFYKYDRYKGVKEMMPFAKGVSAKSHAFDEKGNEIKTDYRKMLKIVMNAGYHGYIGIEYEGNKHSEVDGIKLTKKLLETIRDEIEKEKKK